MREDNQLDYFQKRVQEALKTLGRRYYRELSKIKYEITQRELENERLLYRTTADVTHKPPEQPQEQKPPQPSKNNEMYISEYKRNYVKHA